jgi:S1-C subfamily serine protease
MAQIPPLFFDCVVAIGKSNDGGTTKHWIGTGFLYGKYVEGENESKRYKVFLVSNKHVFSGQNLIYLRFNPKDNNPAKDYRLTLVDASNNPIWIGHPTTNVDVAVISIDASILEKEGMQFSFFQSDTMVFSKSKLKDIQTTKGDTVYVLGYPMGIVTDRSYVILRGGVISRIRDMLDGYSSDFIVDAFVFPGNSGGPVIIRPEMMTIAGTKSNNQAALIGIIKSYIPYTDAGISQQTGRTRILFEDNTGLSQAEPIDYVIEAIEEWEKVHNTTS